MYELKSPDQNMSDGVSIARVEGFEANRLNPWETVLLLQDILEAKVLRALPPRYLAACAYYAHVGLITTSKQARH